MNLSQFVSEIGQGIGNLENKNGAQKIFEYIDEDKKGAINLNNLRKITEELGQNPSDSLLKEMIKRISSDDESIHLEDLYKCIKVTE